jgi:hypothetical protein
MSFYYCLKPAYYFAIKIFNCCKTISNKVALLKHPPLLNIKYIYHNTITKVNKMQTNTRYSSWFKLTTLSAYLCTSLAFATSQDELHTSLTIHPETSQIMVEIQTSLANMLAEITLPEVKHQVEKLLSQGLIEYHVNELVESSTAELPEYKFKVVIAD